ncbi:uncharacterized protein MELLADRAFT_61667 [Melampsora larici-populina 98AG31]|uniref:Uncharacterized protein n=1 Tax=Melampsora larici-populina (strain 98AG31 / pathotype 3-4-7) TaxID=747676 RepID=F4RFU8_MELLP|nr:uncharacterized protein MELLADRAFT_61667 [Melampsora larici-populina 98AG31]EGG08415.1 hypothetical protein MELLADRAFT_61667 [Melampsora larici-populina 98AG31]
MILCPRWWENPTPQELAYFNSLDGRSKSEILRWDINHRSHPCIRARMDECFDCGEFGHRRPCISTNPFPCPPPFQDWRRSINGKSYSKGKLRMSLADLAALEAEQAIEAPMDLSSEDIELLESLEQAASTASQVTSTITPILSQDGSNGNEESSYYTTQESAQVNPVVVDLTKESEHDAPTPIVSNPMSAKEVALWEAIEAAGELTPVTLTSEGTPTVDKSGPHAWDGSHLRKTLAKQDIKR